METERRLTASDGARLAYWLHRGGREPRRLAVLVHGAASNHTRWSEFLERTTLKHSWDLLRPDMRGNGSSAFRGRLDSGVWCRDLAEIIEAEGYAQAVLIGHSLGAQIAIGFAARYPPRVSGLVLIDPVFRRALIGRKRWLARAAPLVRFAVWKIRAWNALGIRRSEIPDRDLRALDKETREALERSTSHAEIARRYGSLRLILRHMPTANYLQQVLETVAPLPPLSEIRAPTLVLLSAGITFADPRINREEIARFQRVEVVTIDANHWPLTERPDETRRAIEGWMNRTFPVHPGGE